jgi:tetratricopeptide (TPR) repeat protein
MNKAYELDPLSLAVNRNYGFLLYMARKYDDALKMLRKAAELDPSFSYTYFCMGLVYLRTQDYEKAIEVFKKERELTGGVNPIVVIPLGTAYARMGDREKAEEILAGVEERMKHEYVSPFFLAQFYFTLGELDTGFELLDRAYAERDISLRHIKAFPMEDAVLRDPRYNVLLEKMKLN